MNAISMRQSYKNKSELKKTKRLHLKILQSHKLLTGAWIASATVDTPTAP